jgi:hypothetical protein
MPGCTPSAVGQRRLDPLPSIRIRRHVRFYLLEQADAA